jgi:hypothetical protein
VHQLQGHLDQTLSTSSKTPSSDSPFKKLRPRQSSSKHGGQKGHPSAGPKLLEPTDVEVILQLSCSCSHAVVSAPTLYRTHQVLELPPLQLPTGGDAFYLASGHLFGLPEDSEGGRSPGLYQWLWPAADRPDCGDGRDSGDIAALDSRLLSLGVIRSPDLYSGTGVASRKP